MSKLSVLTENHGHKKKKHDTEVAKMGWDWQAYLDEVLRSGRKAKAQRKLKKFAEQLELIIEKTIREGGDDIENTLKYYNDFKELATAELIASQTDNNVELEKKNFGEESI
jgi:hypothetical protein